jgi:hypothetical protein
MMWLNYVAPANWEEADPQTRSGQRVHVLKYLSMVGGLLLAAAEVDRSAAAYD